MGGDADHPHYKYGGTWKNKHAYVSAKIKGKAKEENALGYRQGRPWKKGARRLGVGGQKERREMRGRDQGEVDEEESSGEEEEWWEWDGEAEVLGGR
jgi:hypothetical protein